MLGADVCPELAVMTVDLERIMVTGAKILCIEDDSEVGALICEDLAERGYRVSFARDGQEGLSAIFRENPDLVIADISMPVMSGFELLNCLNQLEPRFGNIPFIFLTALGDRDNELKGRRLGADDYVTKPVDFEILDYIITARLHRVAREQVWPGRIQLKEREVDALTWAARGKTSQEIAQILNLSKRTVDFHIDSARDKLGVTTRVQAAIKATVGGLIEP